MQTNLKPGKGWVCLQREEQALKRCTRACTENRTKLAIERALIVNCSIMLALNESEKPLVSYLGTKEQRLILLCSRSHSNRESGTNEELVQLWPERNERTTIIVADNRLAERTAQSHMDKGPKTSYKRPKGTEKSLCAFPTRQTQTV